VTIKIEVIAITMIL